MDETALVPPPGIALCYWGGSVAVPTFPVCVDQRPIAGRGRLLAATSEHGRDGDHPTYDGGRALFPSLQMGIRRSLTTSPPLRDLGCPEIRSSAHRIHRRTPEGVLAGSQGVASARPLVVAARTFDPGAGRGFDDFLWSKAEHQGRGHVLMQDGRHPSRGGDKTESTNLNDLRRTS